VKVKVECYSGFKADERPLRFEWSGRAYEVAEVLDQWYGTEATYFRVLADDGNLYILRHRRDPLVDEWTIEAFREA